MTPTIGHDRNFETIEAKTLWFSSLPLEERMEIFCSFTDLAVSISPELIHQCEHKPIPGHVQVLELSNR
jgi:hypothetical protein